MQLRYVMFRLFAQFFRLFAQKKYPTGRGGVHIYNDVAWILESVTNLEGRTICALTGKSDKCVV